MHYIRLSLTLTLFVIGFLPRAAATLWTGTINEIATTSTDPLIDVGETYLGSYSYESDTIDGTWKIASGSVTYSIQSFYYDQFMTGGIISSDNSGSLLDTLTVDNGNVTYFIIFGSRGSYEWNASVDILYSNRWVFGDSNIERKTAEIALTFSNPQAVPDGVSNSGILVCLGAIGLLVSRRFSSHRMNKNKNSGS